MQDPETKKAFLQSLAHDELRVLHWCWSFWARPDQLPPGGNWRSWLLLGGRGAGKTRAGAEWVRALVESKTSRRIALIGETYNDARAIMVEGASGILSCCPPYARPMFIPSRQLLVWANGAQAQIFSAERPDSLRGPQFDAAWCDELAKWRYGEQTWDMLQFALRLGTMPRQVITTTPRPTALVKRLLGDPQCVVTRSATDANRDNLAPGFMEEIVGRYKGTHLGRQELEGQIIDDMAQALWSLTLLDRQRCRKAPLMARHIVALDPPASSGPKADSCGIVVIGLGHDGYAYVLDDKSVQGLSPNGWARRVCDAYAEYDADCLIAEVNQGGELVREIILREAPDINFKPVRAIKGKLLRAEPVAALYERGLVFHVGCFEELEDEMCNYAGTGASPDRLDALVWGVSSLLLRPRATQPIIRRL